MDVPEAIVVEARQDVLIATELFEEKARKLTWYFAWREGEEIVPEKVMLHEKSFNRLFLETQVLLTFVFITLGLGLFIVVNFYPTTSCVPIIRYYNSFCFLSNKIIARSGDWTITKTTYHTLLGVSAAIGSLGAA
jgi:hypothetical protein